MKKNIILLMLLCLSMITYAVNPIKEGNMISGHVIVKGTEENARSMPRLTNAAKAPMPL